MTEEEAARLEGEFGIALPSAYRAAVTAAAPLHTAGELVSSAEELRAANRACRKDGRPWGFQWQDRFWFIGDDGLGGLYFLDTVADDSTVFYLDHEMPAQSFVDREKLRPMAFGEFLNQFTMQEAEHARRDAETKAEAATRKWWQFWIPRP